MPQVKSAESLCSTCLVFISKNMDKFCTESNVNEQLDDGDAIDFGRSIANPFDQLRLLEALIKLIIKQKFEDEHTGKFLPQLITPHLLSLSLPAYPTEEEINLHYILHLATIRCKHLKMLRLGYNVHLYPDCLNFIPKFSHLQVLDISKFDMPNISFSISGDDLLHLLGIHCIYLRELYAKNNLVSDAGIQGLCVIGNCKSIRKLDLMGNPLTTKGIQMIFDNLPSLELLFHKSLINDLASIAQSASDQRLPNLPKYFLSALHLYSSVYRDGSLEKSIRLCPYITDLRIYVVKKGLKNSELLSLLSLKILYSLSIMHFVGLPSEVEMGGPLLFDEDLTFHGGVLPLLKRFGNSLKRLKLEGYFHDLDTSAVIELCPNLGTLILHKSYKLKWAKEIDWELLKTEQVPSLTVSVLKNLEKLDLAGVPSSHPFVSSEDLFKLLSSPVLKHVRLNKIDKVLTDEILERANDLHSFRNLQSLTISSCDSVTKKRIDVFMQEENPLQKIVAVFCENITPEDAIEWKEKAIWKKKNWRLQFVALN